MQDFLTGFLDSEELNRQTIRPYTPEQLHRMNRSDRGGLGIGRHPEGAVLQAAKRFLNGRTDIRKVLDYGAGREAATACHLEETYGLRVDAYEIGANAGPNHVVHWPRGYYDLVLCSNVLNVQPNMGKILNVLMSCWTALRVNGVLIVNYPAEPRHSDVSRRAVSHAISQMFDCVQYDGGVWKCSKPSAEGES